MPPEDRVRILHMIEAAQSIGRFVEGRSAVELDSDEMLLLALQRALEIIGEAASKLSATTRLSAPEIPWGQIVGMRNRLVHAYFRIDHMVLWKTATEEVPEMRRRLEATVNGA